MRLTQIRSLRHVPGPGGWRWVQLDDVSRALGFPASELLERFMGSSMTLGLWLGGTDYIATRAIAGGTFVAELRTEGTQIDEIEVPLSADDVGEFLRIVGPVWVPLGWALEIARLIESGAERIEVVEYYGTYDPEEASDDPLWVWRMRDDYRVAYAV